MKLILTNDNGILLAEWTIGGKPEFDIEALDADPKCSFYVYGDYDNERSFGEVVWKEIEWNYNKGEK